MTYKIMNKKFNELTVDELSKITSTMDPILHLILTGGEPYLRNDYTKLLKFSTPIQECQY